MRLRDVVAKVNANTVAVLSGNPGDPNSLKLLGTGFIVTDAGFIATCAHVIREPGQYWVATTDLMGGVNHLAPVDPRILFEQNLDLALLKVMAPVGATVTLLEAGAEIHAGDAIALIGYPEGVYSRMEGGLIVPNVRSGIISGACRDRTGKWMLWVDAAVHPGNSGSPVFRAEDGVVVGMITAMRVDQPIPGIIVPRDLGQALLAGAIIKFLEVASSQGIPVGHWRTAP